ncbi:GAF domain-containing protein [Mycobacterium sp. SMC-4]|uniref:GAF domain-containing protein n=1 Tax=Mycobacterium sp. SMC-4 TaxID=2857059 RepID=UPI0021B2F625|nr:GAF domain-containing protein [Mycobacterium sp. SMC-4]UXA18740.1 GAF domain-containing protein [Mycobacterium sp. SMC-4]
MTNVYRAPMRSRRDDVDPQLALERAHAHRLCGFGRHGHGDSLPRRVQRLAAVPDGSLVWTRDGDGWYWLGRIDGPYFYDADGESVDLVHVRPCTWRTEPVAESRCPAAVVKTFHRGGRNFQQIHHPHVGQESESLWERR